MSNPLPSRYQQQGRQCVCVQLNQAHLGQHKLTKSFTAKYLMPNVRMALPTCLPSSNVDKGATWATMVKINLGRLVEDTIDHGII